MSKIEYSVCDIEGCDNRAFKIDKPYHVKFMTEQNEGRAVTPYIETKKLDLCESHYSKLIELTLIIAFGAQGHNKYSFKELL